MNSKPLKAIVLIAAGVAVLAVAIDRLNVVAPPPAPRPRESQLEQLLADAFQSHHAGNWPDAREKWDAVLGKLPTGPEYAGLRSVAERNRQTCVKLLQPEKPPVAEKTFPAPKEKPTPVPRDKLIAAYPQGRKVRNICYLFIDGKGQNDDWVFRGKANFHYQHRVAVETTVKENRGTAVVFEQHFVSVDELRAVSNQELEFQWPESPILTEVWNQLDEQLRQIPVYRAVRMAGKVIDALDPNGKRTLTRLQRFIPGLAGQSHLEIVERVRELSGQRLEVEYVSGLGVVSIKVLDGQRLDPDLLDRVARGSTVLVDYFVGEAAQDEQDEVSLDAKDVGDMFHLAEEGSVTGQIRLQRAADQPDEAELTILDGELNVELDELGVKRRMTVEPIEGSLRYSTAEMLLKRADATWRFNGRLESSDYLLFGTTGMIDLKVRTYCESQLIQPGGDGQP